MNVAPMPTLLLSLDDLVERFLEGRINKGELFSELCWRDEQHERAQRRVCEVRDEVAMQRRIINALLLELASTGREQ